MALDNLAGYFAIPPSCDKERGSCQLYIAWFTEVNNRGVETISFKADHKGGEELSLLFSYGGDVAATKVSPRSK